MAADPRTLNVTCPHCAARYLLPAHLLGPGGARVRCPGCSRSFDVPPPLAASGPPPADSRPSIAPSLGDRESALAQAEADVESAVREQTAAARAPDPPERSAAAAPASKAAFGDAAGAAAAAGGGPDVATMSEPDATGAREKAAREREAEPAMTAAAELLPPEAVAREVLEAVALQAGADLAEASAKGYLFARFGPQIFAAFDEYRRRAGDAGSAPFRAALRGLWGVDLPEPPRRR